MLIVVGALFKELVFAFGKQVTLWSTIQGELDKFLVLEKRLNYLNI